MMDGCKTKAEQIDAFILPMLNDENNPWGTEPSRHLFSFELVHTRPETELSR